MAGDLEEYSPQITALDDGGFVVTWNGDTSDGQAHDVFVQRFDAAGVATGGPTRLQGMAGHLADLSPQITALAGGGFVVTWYGGQEAEIFVQGFDAEGVVTGGPTRLQGMTGIQGDYFPQIAALDDGGFVVTWYGNTSDGQGFDIFVQRFDAAGETSGGLTRLQGMAGNLTDYTPRITALDDGGFVVMWVAETTDGQGYDIFVQGFDAAGETSGGLSRMRGMAGYLGDYAPRITALDGGGFVVTWAAETSDGPEYDIFVQGFDAAGVAAGGPTRLQGMAGNLVDYAPWITALEGGRVRGHVVRQYLRRAGIRHFCAGLRCRWRGGG
ncbi:hypothetical protein [Ruixingdingia sedimenti]|uniref:Uncharacterized protein n=1 Tax=Ruixingdingia sedimenti TaxID=3073604 RepID=A0ABU1FA39_9RHOB|nr:hypothetical protein [Xinfangfangia sp. LG-4]MDR5653757.1 hypothetical protein [Xinfangfangia sp. LG-4]